MALLRSTLRPMVASARMGGAPVLRRNMTQNSAEAQRYSFKHAVEDITAAGDPKEMATRSLAHAQEVGLRFKHGWFRDGVTHPNSDLPPDGLARMTWNSEAIPKFNAADPFSYTPTQ